MEDEKDAALLEREQLERGEVLKERVQEELDVKYLIKFKIESN